MFLKNVNKTKISVMKRKFSESSEKVEMETKLEDVPDDPEGSDQIRINLLIKEPQIIEVRLKLFF